VSARQVAVKKYVVTLSTEEREQLEVLIRIGKHSGDRRKIGGQATIAIGGHGWLAGWNFWPKPEPSVPL